MYNMRFRLSCGIGQMQHLDFGVFSLPVIYIYDLLLLQRRVLHESLHKLQVLSDWMFYLLEFVILHFLQYRV